MIELEGSIKTYDYTLNIRQQIRGDSMDRKLT